MMTKKRAQMQKRLGQGAAPVTARIKPTYEDMIAYMGDLQSEITVLKTENQILSKALKALREEPGGAERDHALAALMVQAAREGAVIAAPLYRAMSDMLVSFTGLSAYASFAVMRFEPVRAALRPELRKMAELLYRDYQTFDHRMRERNIEIPPLVKTGVLELHEAALEFSKGGDNIEQLRSCAALESGVAGALTQIMINIRFGGANVSPPREWIGREVQAIYENVQDYREAIKMVYRKLIRLEDQKTIGGKEKEALAELDTRDQESLRQHGTLMQATYEYAYQAARDWKKRNANGKTALMGDL